MHLPLPHLPIDPFLPQISETFLKNPAIILQASPGSGKTTRVPPVLLKIIPAGKEVWVLVPRRLAAKAAARRIAEELGESVGETVGYQFRFEKVASSKTRIRLMTEGLFLKLLRQDPGLQKVDVVVLDEFHERHLHTDAALALLKKIQERRPDFKIVVMSATIETRNLAAYIPSSQILKIDSQPHPLEISYLPHIPQANLEDLVFQSLHSIHKKNLEGDVLVFLPGIADIRRCEKKLGGFPGAKVLTLYGDLSKDEQDAVFQKIPERKIVLSTNIAESSITIPGISIVIDSGLHRQASFSHWSGIPSLKTRPISQASAIQRAGRAARLGPGLCFRLYTRSDFEGRIAFEKPEISRADLSELVLELKNLGHFPLDWFEHPPPQNLQKALDLLYQLNAIHAPESRSDLTDLGRDMAELPLHPRLSRMLIESKKRDCALEAIHIASLISEGDLQRLDILEELKRRDLGFETKKLMQSLTAILLPSPQFRRQRKSDFPTDNSTKRAQLASQMGALSVKPSPSEKFFTENISQSLLTAFPDRVGQKKTRAQGIELALCLGGSALLKPDVRLDPFLQESDYFLVLDVQETDHVFARSLAALQPEWLLDDRNPLFSEKKDAVWDAKREKVMTVHSLRYGELVLDTTALESSEKSLECLLTEGLGFPKEGKIDVHQWIQGFGKVVQAQELETLMVRLDLWKRYHHQGLEGFEWRSDELFSLAKKIIEGCSSLKELKSQPLLTAIKTALVEDISLFDRCLPTTYLLPNKRHTKIHYAWGKDPWIASRLQDFFGMKEVQILNGRISLTFHLLAPNHRPVQVTKDLSSFWKNIYPTLRKELSRKYPRHSWPETVLG